MAFRWRADDDPRIVVLGSSLPSSTKKTLSKLDPLWQNFLDPRMQRCKTIFCGIGKTTDGFTYVCVMVNHIIYGTRRKKTCLRGLRTTKAQSDQRLCCSIVGNTEYTLFRLLTTIVIASPGLHVIFNIESGQNVNRPVTCNTRQYWRRCSAFTSHRRQYYVVWQHVMKFFEGCPRESNHQLISSWDKTKQYWRRCSALTSHRRQYFVALDMLKDCSHSFIG